jgi:hypothetical protein
MGLFFNKTEIFNPFKIHTLNIYTEVGNSKSIPIFTTCGSVSLSRSDGQGPYIDISYLNSGDSVSLDVGYTYSVSCMYDTFGDYSYCCKITKQLTYGTYTQKVYLYDNSKWAEGSIDITSDIVKIEFIAEPMDMVNVQIYLGDGGYAYFYGNTGHSVYAEDGDIIALGNNITYDIEYYYQ